MSDEETVMLFLRIIAFIFGILVMASGLGDVGQALNPDLWFSMSQDVLSLLGTGSMKAIFGLALVIAVIAPDSLQMRLQR